MNKNGLVIICLSVLFISCGLSKAKPEAEELWSRYFSAIQSGSFQDVLPLYSNKFYKNTPRKNWIKILKKIQEKLGTPKSYKQINWKVQAQVQPSGRSGTVVTLVYQVKYSIHDAQETIMVFKPASGGKVLIFAHRINSNSFLFNNYHQNI